MSYIAYNKGTRLRHIDGSEATVTKDATTYNYVVCVENDGGNDELWPRDEIACFGVLRTGDIPFLVQRILHTGSRTTMDVGVVHAIGAEQARTIAVEKGLIKSTQSVNVLNLKRWADGVVPKHFVTEQLSDDERKVLSQALADYNEGVERNCEDDEMREFLKTQIESIGAKLIDPISNESEDFTTAAGGPPPVPDDSSDYA